MLQSGSLPCQLSMRQDRDRGAHPPFFKGHGMEIVHIISAHIPLARAWSCDHTWMQGSLRNVVQLVPMLSESSEVNGYSDNQQPLSYSISGL